MMTLLGDITVLYYYQVLGYLEPNTYMQQQQSHLSLSLVLQYFKQYIKAQPGVYSFTLWWWNLWCGDMRYEGYIVIQKGAMFNWKPAADEMCMNSISMIMINWTASLAILAPVAVRLGWGWGCNLHHLCLTRYLPTGVRQCAVFAKYSCTPLKHRSILIILFIQKTFMSLFWLPRFLK